ncbi:cysteine proteinase superfamily protein [Arabidopsis thaliana]|uniref:Cysteine proteinase superfamily protein n=1 Tax=Arabidopsis thaliana TaxID=3702 RepID=F4I9H0_ARATH|nr:cysteine proteinase superfamily protein [Arabidopsis thaliana]AEE31924.1 cysteine proteinase superfamily protein [Arabidopsis thaliana]|eukprot:NP_001154399.1 cysteine proteinase superfamily protein [Arabidopsis thaliana]
MLEKLTGTITVLESKFPTLINQKVSALDEELSKRLATLETNLKGFHPADVPIDNVTSNNNEYDEAHNKELSWMVEEKPSSKDGLSVSPIREKKMTKVKEVKVSTPKVLKKAMKRDDDDVVDVTDEVVANTLKMTSNSEDTFSNPQVQQHMGATKIMFHKRFMCDPLKYSNHRIAFLDQDLIRKMEKDYKHFSSDSKTYKWTDYYANHQNDINLKRKRIYVYNNIPTIVDEPEMLRNGGGEEGHEEGPVNHDPVLRIKLGAEMFDELREFAGTLNCEICRKEFELPRLNDS